MPGEGGSFWERKACLRQSQPQTVISFANHTLPMSGGGVVGGKAQGCRLGSWHAASGIHSVDYSVMAEDIRVCAQRAGE